MAKTARKTDEKPNMDMEQHKKDYAVVMEKLHGLVKKGVITDYDLTQAPVVWNGKTVPRIILTFERLLEEGHLKDVEPSITGFCYIAGVGLGSEAAMKKAGAKK